jgi:hypothetical protein
VSDAKTGVASAMQRNLGAAPSVIAARANDVSNSKSGRGPRARSKSQASGSTVDDDALIDTLIEAKARAQTKEKPAAGSQPVARGSRVKFGEDLRALPQLEDPFR